MNVRKKEILDNVYRSRLVHELIQNITHRSQQDFLNDFEQDIYIMLCEMDDDELERLYTSKRPNR